MRGPSRRQGPGQHSQARAPFFAQAFCSADGLFPRSFSCIPVRGGTILVWPLAGGRSGGTEHAEVCGSTLAPRSSGRRDFAEAAERGTKLYSGKRWVLCDPLVFVFVFTNRS